MHKIISAISLAVLLGAVPTSSYAGTSVEDKRVGETPPVTILIDRAGFNRTKRPEMFPASIDLSPAFEPVQRTESSFRDR